MAVDPETLLDSIAENATKPASASQDGSSASQHSLQDQLAVQRAIAGRTAAARGFGGLVRQQVRSPNALGTNSRDT